MKPDQFLDKVCFQMDADVWLDLDKAQGFRKQWSPFIKVKTFIFILGNIIKLLKIINVASWTFLPLGRAPHPTGEP